MMSSIFCTGCHIKFVLKCAPICWWGWPTLHGYLCATQISLLHSCYHNQTTTFHILNRQNATRFRTPSLFTANVICCMQWLWTWANVDMWLSLISDALIVWLIWLLHREEFASGTWSVGIDHFYPSQSRAVEPWLVESNVSWIDDSV